MSAESLDRLYEVLLAASGKEKTVARDAVILGMYREAWPIVWSRLGGAYPDLVSDAVTKAAINLDKFRGEARLSTWFFKIVLSFCNSTIRRKLQRPPEIGIDQLIAEGGEPRVEPARGENAKMDFSVLLGTVKPLDRAILSLRNEGHTFLEIASIMGLPRKTVTSRVARLVADFTPERQGTGTDSATSAASVKRPSGR